MAGTSDPKIYASAEHLEVFSHVDDADPEIEIEEPQDPTPQVEKESEGIVAPETEH